MLNVTVFRGGVKISPVHQQMELSPEAEMTKAPGTCFLPQYTEGGESKAAILDLALRSTMGMIRDPEWERV